MHVVHTKFDTFYYYKVNKEEISTPTMKTDDLSKILYILMCSDGLLVKLLG